jgi:4'-phosphopantetheinyl transferase
MPAAPVESWQGRLLDVELRWSRLPEEVAAADLAILAPAERQRADEFGAARRRVEFVASRAYLRRALAAVLGVEPAAVAISADDFGKPQHVGALQFNLSHSARAVLIGWGSTPLGVDLETAHRATSRIGRIRIVAAVRDALSIELIPAFTLVEATTKALGRGLGAIGRLRIDSVGDAGEIRFASPGARSLVRATSVWLPDDYVGAVAVVG